MLQNALLSIFSGRATPETYGKMRVYGSSLGSLGLNPFPELMYPPGTSGMYFPTLRINQTWTTLRIKLSGPGIDRPSGYRVKSVSWLTAVEVLLVVGVDVSSGNGRKPMD
jgi:hypothetical protein